MPAPSPTIRLFVSSIPQLRDDLKAEPIDCAGSTSLTTGQGRRDALQREVFPRLTQDNRQVCFLQLHHGNRPISIAELERMELGAEGQQPLAAEFDRMIQSHQQSITEAAKPKKLWWKVW